MRKGGSDCEIALPAFELEIFARSEGYFRDLPAKLRPSQMDRHIDLYEQLFQAWRFHLFDARCPYSAPITAYGPLLALLYLGRRYIAFSDNEWVQAFTMRFDALVLAASIPSREFPERPRERGASRPQRAP